MIVRGACLGVLCILSSVLYASAAERIANPVAMFAGLNKITGITTNFEANVGQDVSFGIFTMKASACYTRPITEAPKTVAFVQIDVRESSGKASRVFSGWMFAESPGLNAVEHPVLDVWLTGCRDPNAPPPPVEEPQVSEEGVKKEEADEPLD